MAAWKETAKGAYQTGVLMGQWRRTSLEDLYQDEEVKVAHRRGIEHGLKIGDKRKKENISIMAGRGMREAIFDSNSTRNIQEAQVYLDAYDRGYNLGGRIRKDILNGNYNKKNLDKLKARIYKEVKSAGATIDEASILWHQMEERWKELQNG